jgi:hypothetical protein
VRPIAGIDAERHPPHRESVTLPEELPGHDVVKIDN